MKSVVLSLRVHFVVMGETHVKKEVLDLDAQRKKQHILLQFPTTQSSFLKQGMVCLSNFF